MTGIRGRLPNTISDVQAKIFVSSVTDFCESDVIKVLSNGVEHGGSRKSAVFILLN